MEPSARRLHASSVSDPISPRPFFSCLTCLALRYFVGSRFETCSRPPSRLLQNTEEIDKSGHRETPPVRLHTEIDKPSSPPFPPHYRYPWPNGYRPYSLFSSVIVHAGGGDRRTPVHAKPKKKRVGRFLALFSFRAMTGSHYPIAHLGNAWISTPPERQAANVPLRPHPPGPRKECLPRFPFRRETSKLPSCHDRLCIDIFPPMYPG